MTSDQEMIRSSSFVPESVFGGDHVQVVLEKLNEILVAVRARDVESFLQHFGAERKIEEVSFTRVFGDKRFAGLELFHKPSLRCIYSFQHWLMQYGSLAFSVNINLELFLH